MLKLCRQKTFLAGGFRAKRSCFFRWYIVVTNLVLLCVLPLGRELRPAHLLGNILIMGNLIRNEIVLQLEFHASLGHMIKVTAGAIFLRGLQSISILEHL